jgi:hypothetical protein
MQSQWRYPIQTMQWGRRDDDSYMLWQDDCHDHDNDDNDDDDDDETHSLQKGNEFLPRSFWSICRIILVPFLRGTRIPFFHEPKKGILQEFLAPWQPEDDSGRHGRIVHLLLAFDLGGWITPLLK